jgi:hypothetical protein
MNCIVSNAFRTTRHYLIITTVFSTKALSLFSEHADAEKNDIKMI